MTTRADGGPITVPVVAKTRTEQPTESQPELKRYCGDTLKDVLVVLNDAVVHAPAEKYVSSTM